MRAWAWLVAATILTGCGAETALRLDVLAAPGEQDVRALSVTAFDAHGVLVSPRRMSPVQLPGSIILRRLPALAQALRVAVTAEGTGATGAAVVQIRPGQTTAGTVFLSTTTPDQDADGVPDVIDDCPAQDNPVQADTDGDGQGDACDGAPPDAAAPDLNTVDLAGSDGGTPSLCATFNGLDCEGFEGSLPAAWRYFIFSGSAVPTSAQRYRGATSYALSTNPTSTFAYANLTRSGLPASGKVYVRAFLYAPAPPSSIVTSILGLAQPAGGSNLAITVGLAADGKLTLENRVGATMSTSATALPVGRWVCVELEATLADAGAAHLRLDGVELTDLAQSGDTNPTPALTDLYVGPYFENLTSQIPAYTLYVDEVAIDDAPVGCNR